VFLVAKQQSTFPERVRTTTILRNTVRPSKPPGRSLRIRLLSNQSSSMADLYLVQARNAVSVHDCMSIYEKWAATYNTEVNDEAQTYVAPALIAQVAVKLSRNPAKSVILDAGCGTGLVGQALANNGAKIIDGIDLSTAMLTVANQTGVYRALAQADLTQRIDIVDETYDVVTCVGTFTLGHVGPDPALRELVRITRKNGTVVATVQSRSREIGGGKSCDSGRSRAHRLCQGAWR
jgi:predicted TPR repeat methyltransferase